MYKEVGERNAPPEKPAPSTQPLNSPSSKPNNFVGEVAALKQTYLSQKARGAKASELEITIKAAGKLVADEVKAIKIFDLPPEEKILIEEFRDVRERFFYRLTGLYGKVPQTEFEELYEVYLEVENELFKAERNYPPQQRRIFINRAKQIKTILSRVRSMGATPAQLKAQFGNSSSVGALAETALNSYPADWIEASVKRGKILTKKAPTNERGFYDGRLIQIESSYRLDSAIHEFGHRLEEAVKGILEAEAEFYNRRTAGEKLEKLSALTGDGRYKDWEVARKDKFLDAYIGKDYGGKSYELVSTGFQWAYTEPLFLLQDEDFAHWIFGLLALI